LLQAGIQGVAVPLTAAAVGGLVGAALWFTRPSDAARRRGPAVALLLWSVLAVSVLYTGLGLMEVNPVLQGLHFALHMLIAVFALLALRIGLQAALLHEAHDEMNPGEQVLCPHCDHVVPDMAFCPNRGVAARAASRTSRAAQRNPADTDGVDGAAGVRGAGGIVCGGARAPDDPRPAAAFVGCRCGRRSRGCGCDIASCHAGGAAICLPARDVARSRDFYADIFGGRVVLEENPAIVKVDCGRPPIGDPIPPILRPALAGVGGWERLQRFAEAAHYRTLQIAAQELGLNQFALVDQINRIERDLGDKLLVRAKSGQPMKLTPFGSQVLSAVHGYAKLRERS
jgi:catechol 2,3-dioxygenase-like lactoylglutathione lyase family enzyme